jgi:AcrR family transcriptional regulator
MAAAREAAAPAAAAAEPAEALYRKLSPGPGRPAREVALHQRARIHGAMVEIVGERGYRAVTVRELARLAGVSTRAFYEHFDGKEDCFLRTYELVVQRAAGRIVAAQRGEHDWEARLQCAFSAFADEIESKPHAGRLALVETLAVGPSALEQMRRAEGMFEAMVGESFSKAPDEVATPALIVKGIVAGVGGVARTRLLEDGERQLPDIAEELMEWALSYRCEAAAEIGGLDGGTKSQTGAGRESEASAGAERESDGTLGDERALILSAVAKLAAADGYWQLTVPRIRSAAGVSRRSFDAQFESVEDCFLAALELRVERALSQAKRAYVEAPSWPLGIHRALGALCDRIARDPVLGRLGFAEAFAPGLDSMRRRESIMTSISALFRESAPAELRPTELMAEASVAAIWGILHYYVGSGQAQRLGQVVPVLSYLALAPALGASVAADALLRERSPLALQPVQ